MKKAIAIILCALLLLAVAAGCAQGETDGSASEPKESRTDKSGKDNSDGKTEPEGYETVERLINRSADSTLNEKDINYDFEDNTGISYGFVSGYSVVDALDVETAESAEYAGKTFYMLYQGATIYALADGDGGLYCVSVYLADENDKSLFNLAMDNISFADTDNTWDNGNLLEGIHWDFQDDWKLAGILSVRTESPDGKLIKDRITFSFGDDLTNPDWRFSITGYRDALLADELDPEYTYVDQEINGVVYSVYSYYETPYDYLTQRGDDVWKISNAGVLGYLFYNRSEESAKAFEYFIDSIRFD